ncbi:hypothetical protein [Glaesserella sp.]|uniref:hypothetical protein n=1 Tax=Glaesserella sp. TaxID=2094731 RepID=UPI00359FBC57
MKYVFKFISSAFLALFLVGCAAQTTMDPAVGKADYHKLITWLNSTEQFISDKELEKALSGSAPSEEEEVKMLTNALNQKYNQIIRGTKELDLRHVEVRKLRDLCVEIFELMRPAMLSIYVPTRENIEQAEKVEPKLLALEEQIDELGEKLDKQFGSE